MSSTKGGSSRIAPSILRGIERRPSRDASGVGVLRRRESARRWTVLAPGDVTPSACHVLTPPPQNRAGDRRDQEISFPGKASLLAGCRRVARPPQRCSCSGWAPASWSAPAASRALRAGEIRPVVAARAADLTMALTCRNWGRGTGRGLIPGFLQPMPESIAGATRGSTNPAALSAIRYPVHVYISARPPPTAAVCRRTRRRRRAPASAASRAGAGARPRRGAAAAGGAGGPCPSRPPRASPPARPPTFGAHVLARAPARCAPPRRVPIPVSSLRSAPCSRSALSPCCFDHLAACAFSYVSFESTYAILSRCSSAVIFSSSPSFASTCAFALSQSARSCSHAASRCGGGAAFVSRDERLCSGAPAGAIVSGSGAQRRRAARSRAVSAKFSPAKLSKLRWPRARSLRKARDPESEAFEALNGKIFSPALRASVNHQTLPKRAAGGAFQLESRIRGLAG